MPGKRNSLLILFPSSSSTGLRRPGKKNKLHSRREFYSLSIYSEYKIKKKSFARLVGSTCPSSPPLNLHDAPQYYVDTHTHVRMNKYDVSIVKNESNKIRYTREEAHTHTHTQRERKKNTTKWRRIITGWNSAHTQRRFDAAPNTIDRNRLGNIKKYRNWLQLGHVSLSLSFLFVLARIHSLVWMLLQKKNKKKNSAHTARRVLTEPSPRARNIRFICLTAWCMIMITPWLFGYII
jgi:hypothetical protein